MSDDHGRAPAEAGISGGRRYNCRCGKKRHRDEQAALAAAARDVADHGGVVTVYRCPGGLAWHLTSTGFRPASLRTVGRRLAYELLTHEVVDLDGFRVRDERKRLRAGQCAEQMRQLGLAQAAGPNRLTAADRAGLWRVIQVGLDSYAAENGIRLPPPGRP